MNDSAPSGEAGKPPANGGGLPYGLLIGIALGFAIGLARGDFAAGAGLAVALGISLWFLSPLVRSLFTKTTPEGAARAESGASSEEHDHK